MGEQVDNIFLSVQLSDDDQKKYDVVLEKFQGHFMKWRNVIYEWMKFNWRIKQEGKSVESFIIDLHTLSEMCNYRGLTNEIIRNRIVVSIQDDPIAEHLHIDLE